MILSLKVKSDLKPQKMANYVQRLQLKEVWILIKSVSNYSLPHIIAKKCYASGTCNLSACDLFSCFNFSCLNPLS